MSTQYTHLELGKDVMAGIAGYYTPQKEVRLQHDGREVLYVIGEVVVESDCHDGACSVGSWTYARVPGYVVNWQNTQNGAGLPVSEVEAIADEAAQASIRQTIQTNEATYQIGFW